MSGRRGRQRLALAAALLMLPVPVVARKPARPAARPRAAGESAERLVRSSDAALQAGDPAAAERILSGWLRSQGAQAALFHLGRVALAQGRAVAAQDFMRRFLAASPDSPPAQRQEAERALGPPLPSGEVAVLGEPGGWVRLDGRLVGQLPLPLPLLVAPGAHEVELEVPAASELAPRKAPLKAALTVKAERYTEVRFERATAAVMISELPTMLLFLQARGRASEAAARLQQAVVERLRSERLTALPTPLPAATGCAEGPLCQLAVLAERGVSEALLVEVEALGGAPGDGPPAGPAPATADFRIKVSLLDAQVGEVAHKCEQRCAGCTVEALAAQVAGASSEAALQGRSRRRGELVVTTDPPGAILELSGRIVGPTPYRGVRFTGSYAAMLRHPGYQELTQPVVIEEGRPAELRLKLEPVMVMGAAAVDQLVQPVRLVEHAARPPWRLGLGAGLTLGGVVTAGFGAAALATDGGCYAPPVPPAQQCELRYSTLPLGAGLLGAGAAVTLLGVVLMAVPGPRREYKTTVTLHRCPAGRGPSSAAAAGGSTWCADPGGR